MPPPKHTHPEPSWRPGHAQADTLRKSLCDPTQGGRQDDAQVLADLPKFLEDHVDTFYYDAATARICLRIPRLGCTPLPVAVCASLTDFCAVDEPSTLLLKMGIVALSH